MQYIKTILTGCASFRLTKQRTVVGIALAIGARETERRKPNTTYRSNCTLLACAPNKQRVMVGASKGAQNFQMEWTVNRQNSALRGSYPKIQALQYSIHSFPCRGAFGYGGELASRSWSRIRNCLRF